ncbi:MAG: cofactor-independent phosphoglycerate mutase [Planctomycetia bacterium]|nr:cofactor-independent phosphoglycerate mutase [Planctomycetia bacterium]
MDSVAKRVIVIPDGFADDQLKELGNRTPMQAARTATLDSWAPRAAQGRSFNVPESLAPGSDVATLSLLGYDPLLSYTGRAPLEVAAQGIELDDEDWAFRCNLVTIVDGVMNDFTAGHVSTPEATQILRLIQETVAPRWREISAGLTGTVEFLPSVSYRNLAIFRPSASGEVFPFDQTTKSYPPHDYTDQEIAQALPTGSGADALRALMRACRDALQGFDVNRQRIAEGKKPVTDCWLWGQGKRPRLQRFAEKFHWGPGVMITAVDLLRGIARNLGWNVLNVPGATGYVDTNFVGKGQAAAEALDEYDIVVVHVEAPDESGHEGSVEKKIASLENIDALVLPPILDKLQTFDNWRLLISPDHPTPVALKTHTRGFVPWAIIGSDVQGDGFDSYDEGVGAKAKRICQHGYELMTLFLNGALQ